MIPVADGHCDFLYGMMEQDYDLGHPKKHQTIILDDMLQGGVLLQFFAVWIDMQLETDPLHQCITMIDCYYRMLEQYKEKLYRLTSNTPLKENKIATVITLEGGEALHGSASVLRILKKLGITAVALTWNDNNELSGAAMGRGNKGLSDIGKILIEEMNDNNIAIDVSHLSDEGIKDCFEISTQPIFASHSNCRDEYYSKRSLTDEQIKRIADNGGTVGINFYHKQLNAGFNTSIEQIVRHIEHCVNAGGIECCAIGSDFDGMGTYPKDLKTSKDFPALIDSLRKHGYKDSDIEKIMYKNLYRYISQFV